MDMEEDDLKRLELVSPYGGETAVYTWPLHQSDKDNKTDGCIEIIETIRWVFEDIPELRDAIRQELNNFTIGEEMKNYDSMKNLCDKYNTALEEILQRKPLKKEPLKRPDTGLLKHIIQKSYNHAVTDPEKLNEYKSWSPEVYGETSFEFVAQMLETINVSEDDIFIDLGSGVGQVVLQVAASVPLKKCIGIEKADVPDCYARELDRHFKFWMQWFGRTYSEYELIKGDFFEEKFHHVVTNSTFIFVNNYAFGPKVDHALKKLFEELKDGSRIFSSKAFSPVNFRITDRNLNDIGTMMHVRELQPAIKGSVSWTDNSVSYYCHTIDRTKLENYFLNMKGPRKDGEKRSRGRPRNSDSSNISSGNDSSNDSASPASSSNHDSGNGGSKSTNNKGSYSTASKGKQENKSSKGNSFDDENIIYGPTTRKAWNEYWNSLSQSQKKDNDTGNITSAATTKTKKDNDKGSKLLSDKRVDTRSSDKEINNENEEQPVKKARGRPRKYAPGVSAVVNRAKKGKVTKASKVPIISEHRRGRPPKHGKGGLKKKGGKEGSSLDMLHQQTLLSIQSRSGKRLSPAPGCVDKKLSDASAPEAADEKDKDIRKDDLLSTSPPPFPSSLASLVTPGVMPSVIIKDSSLLSVNEELDRLMEKWKSQMLSFLTHMQMPEFKSSLVKQIEAEKNRRHSLTAQIDAMEKSIKGLQEKGVFALRAKLSELGIHANTSDEVLDQARQIVAHNKALLEKESQLQAQVAREESVYAEICRVYEKNIREKKIDRRFFQELTGTLDTHKRLQDSERSENIAPEKSSTPSSASSSPARSQNSRTTRSTPQNKNGPERDSETPLSGVGLPPLKKATVPKQVKAKKEPKKRGRKPKAADKNVSLTDGSLPEPPPLKKPFDLSDAKISIKGSPLRHETGNKTSTGLANSGSSPSEHRDSPTHEKSEEAPRLTLTFVINREKNNFSVKSPSKTPPHKSPYPAKNSPKSPADAVVAASNKRKKRSPSRDSPATTTRSATKKTRSSKSSGPDTSSESEARIKIKLGPKDISVEPVVSNSPATNNTTDERNKSVPSTPTPIPNNSSNATSTNTIPSAVTSESQTTTTASRLTSSNGKRSKFDKLLAVASHEMSLQAAAEASNSGSTSSLSSSVLGEATRTLVPSPSISASSRPSSSASSSSFNTTSTSTTNNPPAISQQHHQTLSDVAFGRRAPCVNTPPQTPSPSLSSSDRPITPGGGSTTSSMSPLLHQQHQNYQQHIQNQQQSQQQQSSNQPGNSGSFSHNFSDSLAAHLQNPHHSLSSSESSSHHQFFNSLQSMKNLASMTAFGVPQQPGMDSSAPRRKPGRPPKKSISNEMWASQPPMDSQPRTTLPEQLSNSSGAANLTSSHPHLSSSLNQCQYSNSNDNVATDYSVIRNRNSQTTNSTSNAYGQHQQQASSSSTNSSSQSKTSYGSRSSSSTPVSSHPDGMSNYYPHNPYAPPGPSGPQSVALSVIRRHETSGAPPPPTHQAPYPFPGFPMIAGTYPHLPANIPFESLQKELTRNYNYYNRLNGLVEVALSAQQQKLLQSGPNRSSLDAVCKRDFNPASYQGSKSSQIPSILTGEITPGK